MTLGLEGRTFLHRFRDVHLEDLDKMLTVQLVRKRTSKQQPCPEAILPILQTSDLGTPEVADSDTKSISSMVIWTDASKSRNERIHEHTLQ